MNKNLVYNKHCPICNSMEVIDKKKIKSKHSEINLLFHLKYCKKCGHKFLSSFPKKSILIVFTRATQNLYLVMKKMKNYKKKILLIKVFLK